MGLSIHYKGRIGDIAQTHDLHRDLMRIARESGWKCVDLTAEDTPQIKEFAIKLHQDCEPLFFLFDCEGNLHSPANPATEDHWCFVKTQYAPTDIHIRVVDLLRFVQKNYITNLEVIDDGKYWETGDRGILQATLDFISEKMDLVANAISKIRNAAGLDEYSKADLTEEAIKKEIEADKRRHH